MPVAQRKHLILRPARRGRPVGGSDARRSGFPSLHRASHGILRRGNHLGCEGLKVVALTASHDFQASIVTSFITSPKRQVRIPNINLRLRYSLEGLSKRPIEVVSHVRPHLQWPSASGAKVRHANQDSARRHYDLRKQRRHHKAVQVPRSAGRSAGPSRGCRPLDSHHKDRAPQSA